MSTPDDDPWTRVGTLAELRASLIAENEALRAQQLAQINAFFDKRLAQIEQASALMERDQLGGAPTH